MNTPLEKAISIVGNQSVLARFIGVTPQAVQQWVTVDRVPAHHVIKVEEATNGQVSRYELRPDVFGEQAA